MKGWNMHPVKRSSVKRMELALLILACLSAVFCSAQIGGKVDIRAVARAGHLSKSGLEYENDYLGVIVRLPQPNASLVLNGLIKEDRAILFEAHNKQGNVTQWHNFAIVVHSANIPGLTSITQFVQSVRHAMEQDGFRTVHDEVAFTVAGKELVKSELGWQSNGEHYYKGLMFSRTKGVLFGFWIEALTQEQLEKDMNFAGRIQFR